MNFDRMMKPALIGGLAAGVASAIPFIGWLNCFCCALMIGGGMLASYLYSKESPMASLGENVMVGLLSGVFGALAATLMSIPLHLMGLSLAEVIKRAMIPYAGMPEVREALEKFSIPRLTPGRIVSSALFHMILYGIFGAIGGALGNSLFEKRRGESYPGPTPPYTPPSPSPAAGYPPPPATPPGSSTPPGSTPPTEPGSPPQP